MAPPKISVDIKQARDKGILQQDTKYVGFTNFCIWFKEIT